MITEDYNGICPKCGFDRMLVRYGSWGWFQYDACTKCGYACGQNSEGDYTNSEVWESVIQHFEDSLKEKNLPITRQGIHKLIMSWDNPGERMQSVFKYEEEVENENKTRDSGKG